MPGVLKHLAKDESELLEPRSILTDSNIAPSEESLREEAARLAREIEALTSTNLADYSELSISAESPLNRPHDASLSESRVNSTASDVLFYKLVRLKTRSLHNPPEAELMMDMFESTIDKTKSAHTHFLGQAYWEGWNRPQSLETAYHWFSQSHGNPRAVLPLIACHAFGIGTPRDLDSATRLRTELLESFYKPSEIRRIDQILQAGRIAPPLFTEIPARGQTALAQIQPVFPLQLRKQGVTGRAVMSFQVDAGGFTHNIKPVFTTHPEFAVAAAEALTFWRVASRVNPETGLSGAIRVPIIFNIVDHDDEPTQN